MSAESALAKEEAFVSSELDAVVKSTLVALQGHSTERLRRVAEEAEKRNPKGWLAPMIREYLDVWR